jgi:hypothetical protein
MPIRLSPFGLMSLLPILNDVSAYHIHDELLFVAFAVIDDILQLCRLWFIRVIQNVCSGDSDYLPTPYICVSLTIVVFL